MPLAIVDDYASIRKAMENLKNNIQEEPALQINQMYIDALGLNIIKWCPTGSRIICNPPVMNTDQDFILLIKGNTLSIDNKSNGLDERRFV